MSEYIIGIDLGTTNCTLSYAKNFQDISKNFESQAFHILQYCESETLEKHRSLPSFILFPPETEESVLIGEIAKARAKELPGRVIHSAKSWLSCEHIDRRQNFLPMHSDDESYTISPLRTITHYFTHLKAAWNEAFSTAPFDEQMVLVTVPASFAPDARELVSEAAHQAAYPEILLLEEPLAAFYAWLHAHAPNWREILNVGDTVLVVDVGGGTTDFTLIAVKEHEGNLILDRIAVGEHLLLGGDNMDLALAYFAQSKLEEQGHSLSEWQFQQLVHECRSAKESLLSDQADTYTLTIQGQGSGLIAGSLNLTIEQTQVTQLLVEGFIPLIDSTDRAESERHMGLKQEGLPYAKDPRISAQLAKFLSMTGHDETSSMDTFIMPTAVLFNGGALKGKLLKNQLVSLLNQWGQTLNHPPIKVLQEVDLDGAVSLGATYYGYARQGQAIRVKSGINRSYFVGIEGARPAVPGIPPMIKALCVAQIGMEEGSQCEIEGQHFTLSLGKPAMFTFFSHPTGKDSQGQLIQPGTFMPQGKKNLTELHPIETILDTEEEGTQSVRVHLKTCVTELGMLELWCVADSGQQWKLAFDIRKEIHQEPASVNV